MTRLVFLIALLLPFGCSQPGPAIILATTTSTQDSGLLDELLALFRAETGIEVKVVAVGTGQALQLGRRGDADVVLVHDPAAEEKFMAEGHGALFRDVMYNDFVLVGPQSDPAEVRGRKSIVEAFGRLAQTHSPFISRGDESGTHFKELTIWQKAGLEPRGDWYVQAGAGMGDVLRMANHMSGYTLTDRGTFLAHRQKLELAVLVERDDLLFNPYAVMAVNPEKHRYVKYEAAAKFVNFMVSPSVQDAIARFGVDRYGEPLFYKNASSEKRATVPAQR